MMVTTVNRLTEEVEDGNKGKPAGGGGGRW